MILQWSKNLFKKYFPAKTNDKNKVVILPEAKKLIGQDL